MPHKPSPAKKVYTSQELNAALSRLPETDPKKKMINDMKQQLLQDKFSGEQVAKDRIPRRYREEYGVENLYRYEHPGGYRSCYTIVPIPEHGGCPAILDILTHEEYNRLFGYKRD